MKKSYTLVISLVILVLIVSGCRSSKTSGTSDPEKWNLSAIYNPLSTKLHPVYKVHHQSDNSSVLYVKIFTSELQFQPLGYLGNDISKISFETSLFEIDKDQIIFADSVSLEKTIKKDEASSVYYTQLPLKAEKGKRYQLKIIARDQFRKTFNLQFIDIDKSSEFVSQSYILTDRNGFPIFNNILKSGQLFKLRHSLTRSEKLYIDYYENDLRAPRPDYPRLSDEVLYRDPDSVWVIDYSPNVLLQFTYEGLYYFRFDTLRNDGFAAINPGGDYPRVKEVDELIEPLTYITTDPEYKRLVFSENPKLAVDNYWLKAGGNAGRGRELIRIYYNRVYFANFYFTTARQGWKTDRGMIYVVYGPPHNLRKNGRSEIWYYNQQGDRDPLKFTFNHRPSAYSPERYILDRSTNHEWRWTEAVDSWNSGEIFLLD